LRANRERERERHRERQYLFSPLGSLLSSQRHHIHLLDQNNVAVTSSNLGSRLLVLALLLGTM
jgi:hypothetical protein